MKLASLLFASIIIITSCNSCKQDKSIEFNDITFELPMSEDEAINKFNLNKETTRNGDVDNRNVLGHINTNDSIVGITFYEKQDSYNKLKDSHAAYYCSLKKLYNATFEPIKFSFFTSLTGKYYVMELDNNGIIVLGDVIYNRSSNNYVTVSFFKGVSADEITDYLQNIY
ncbi:hypothetical protein [Flavivirga eckloniae]|uniref:Lipoprotein n=1 Tax=Flavivirga eckloniae TaxID=1803846 RepID=A0A2K9PUP6_9FLAO|nr:hypothetical protein [Flavivirga eckloniae]AUP80774.1 hypothetical protein C1H87_19465 [Flavivirga eckloniae]